MRGRSSAGMEVEKLDKQEPHLSGAYIRSLVKQLTSSRTREHDEDITKLDDGDNTPPPPPPQPKKKQVRRRLHTSRPYQERLLNMAEARREIVTALKFHRAAMKQQQQSQTTWPQAAPSEEQGKTKSHRNQRIYASNLPMETNLPCQYLYSCPVSSQLDHLNFPLPNQTLGLNLNFHDFSNLDATPYRSSIFSTSSSPSEYVVPAQINSEDSSLHPSMDDQEMAEIRLIGEQHDMEWNDTLNLATSTWWFNFLKAMEIEDYGSYPFDQVMEFPAWLNANENCHVHDTYSHNFLLDPTLSCMDIEEIEGMDAEWLS